MLLLAVALILMIGVLNTREWSQLAGSLSFAVGAFCLGMLGRPTVNKSRPRTTITQGINLYFSTLSRKTIRGNGNGE